LQGFFVLGHARRGAFCKPFAVSRANRGQKTARPSSKRGDLHGNRTDDLLHRDQKLVVERRVLEAPPGCKNLIDGRTRDIESLARQFRPAGLALISGSRHDGLG
jgi:hypothetical protein